MVKPLRLFSLHRAGVFFFAATILWSPEAAAQPSKEPRVLIVLDASYSMSRPWSAAETRYQVASRFVGRLMDSLYSIRPDVSFGLRVYGHQYPLESNNCLDTKREVRFSRNDLTQMQLRIAALQAKGAAPAAFALQEALDLDCVPAGLYSYDLFLVTTHEERNCGGSVCEALERTQERLHSHVIVISQAENANWELPYRCFNSYSLLASEPDMDTVIRAVAETYRHPADR